MSAKQRWSEIQNRRSAVLSRARLASKLTIPALIPEEGTNDTTELPTPYQSLGARGVNNLSSKLLLTLFPANTPFVRLQIDEDVAAQLGESKTSAEEALAARERKVANRFESSNLRPILSETLKHLIVGGNAVLYRPEDGDARMFRIDQFCAVRDASGHMLELVIKECVHPSVLAAEVMAACEVKPSEHKNVEIYTHVKWEHGKVSYHEEINDIVVPDSAGSHPEDKTPWIVLRWTAVANNDYGRSLVEEYIGDLQSLEGIAEAIVSFAAVAAKIVLMIRPNSSTSAQDINEAETGEAVTGNPDDVGFLQLDKYYDFQVAKAVHDEITQRLSHAFLLRSGTIRNAERVTAEEIRDTAQELEDVLGGTYTVFASELQLPLVRREMAIMEKKRELPPLPKGVVSPIIVTGFEALGRNHATNKLRAFLSDAANLLGPAIVAQWVNPAVVLKQLGTGHGVEALSDLIKTPEQVQTDQQQMLMAQMGSQAAGPVAGQIAKAVTQTP